MTTRCVRYPPIHIPRPEDTPVGRAAIESAQTSREVATRREALTELVAGLNQTVVTEALPAWFNKVEEDRIKTEEDQIRADSSFQQAAVSLSWTKWAVIASVVVTISATGGQVWVTLDIDRENSAQQLRMEKLLTDQLAVQQKLSEQQAQDAARLQTLVGQQPQRLEKRGLDSQASSRSTASK